LHSIVFSRKLFLWLCGLIARTRIPPRESLSPLAISDPLCCWEERRCITHTRARAREHMCVRARARARVHVRVHTYNRGMPSSTIRGIAYSARVSKTLLKCMVMLRRSIRFANSEYDYPYDYTDGQGQRSCFVGANLPMHTHVFTYMNDVRS